MLTEASELEAGMGSEDSSELPAHAKIRNSLPARGERDFLRGEPLQVSPWAKRGRCVELL